MTTKQKAGLKKFAKDLAKSEAEGKKLIDRVTFPPPIKKTKKK